MCKGILSSFLVLFAILSATAVPADPLPGPPTTTFPVTDYIRGTYGELLHFDNVQVAGKHALRIVNEFRYGQYSTYWDTAGRRQKLDPYEYSRSVNFLGVDYGIGEHLEIGARIPFVTRDLKGEGDDTASKQGLGDLLLRVRVRASGLQKTGLQVTLGAGMKIPTGENEGGDELATGSGSTDLCLMVYGFYDLNLFQLHADMGYVVTGQAGYYDIDGRKLGDQNLGDVFSYDLALVRPLSSLLSGMVELNGYSLASSKDQEGDKLDQGQHRLTLAPGIAIAFPRLNLQIEGGVSHDLFGSNALRGTSPFLRFRYMACLAP